jgi:Bacterial protein of unknown function (DUF899)
MHGLVSRQRDALSAERRTLPMVTIEKEYVFQGPEGRRTSRRRRAAGAGDRRHRPVVGSRTHAADVRFDRWREPCCCNDK